MNRESYRIWRPHQLNGSLKKSIVNADQTMINKIGLEFSFGRWNSESTMLRLNFTLVRISHQSNIFCIYMDGDVIFVNHNDMNLSLNDYKINASSLFKRFLLSVVTIFSRLRIRSNSEESIEMSLQKRQCMPRTVNVYNTIWMNLCHKFETLSSIFGHILTTSAPYLRCQSAFTIFHCTLLRRMDECGV